MFWNIKTVLPYQRLFNWIIGKRTGGKTFGVKDFFVEDFNKHGNQFVYIRRYRTELKMPRFWDSIIKEGKHPDSKLSVNGNVALVDNKICGYGMTLSQALTIKSDEFPNVKTIVLDEFIIENKTYHYLPDEVDAFLSMCYSIGRKRNGLKIFGLANSITISNPYFLKLKLECPAPNKIWTDKFNLVQNFAGENPELEQLSELEQFLMTTDYGDMALKNKFMLDSDIFIEKKGKSHCIFTISYNDVVYGVWLDTDYSTMYVSYDYDPDLRHNYAMSTKDHRPNTMLIKQAKKVGQFKNFMEYYNNGCVRFEHVNIKNIIMEILSKTV